MSLRAFAVVVCVVAAVVAHVRPALAIPPFSKEFEAKYVKPDSADEKEKAFAAAATNMKTGKCNVCHAPGDKKVRNAYGKQLSMLLKKDNFKAERLKDDGDKAKAEIIAALDAVAALKSGDDKSPTFGELIAQGKLPGGDAPPAEQRQAGRARTRASPGTRRGRVDAFARRAGSDRQDSKARRHRAGPGDERRLAGRRLPSGRHAAER